MLAFEIDRGVRLGFEGNDIERWNRTEEPFELKFFEGFYFDEVLDLAEGLLIGEDLTALSRF